MLAAFAEQLPTPSKVNPARPPPPRHLPAVPFRRGHCVSRINGMQGKVGGKAAQKAAVIRPKPRSTVTHTPTGTEGDAQAAPIHGAEPVPRKRKVRMCVRVCVCTCLFCELIARVLLDTRSCQYISLARQRQQPRPAMLSTSSGHVATRAVVHQRGPKCPDSLSYTERGFNVSCMTCAVQRRHTITRAFM